MVTAHRSAFVYSPASSESCERQAGRRRLFVLVQLAKRWQSCAKSLLKEKLNFCHPVPGSSATRAEVVEAAPARPRGPLSNCISKQNPEHVTRATHPPPPALPSAHRGIHRARQRGTPARLSARPPHTHSLPWPRLGFERLRFSIWKPCGPHGDELPLRTIHLRRPSR